MTKWVVALAVLSLAACNSDSDDTEGRVFIECADLQNEGAISECEEQQTASLFPTAYAATTIIDAGVISRGEIIEASLTVNNDTADTFLGYYDMVFSAGCNGADTWPIATMGPTPEILSGEVWNHTVGGACSDMPLGNHTFTATLYGADPANVLDVVEVQFELVE